MLKVSRNLVPLTKRHRYHSNKELGSLLISHEIVGRKDSQHTALFVHGLLGSKRNWRTPIREFLKRHPEYRCIAVDSRGHGDSAILSINDPLESHTIKQTTIDMDQLLIALNIHPAIIFGHSFGGKVALEYVASKIAKNAEIPKHTWILDSIPAKYDDLDHNSPNSVSNILRSIESLPKTFVSREWMQKQLLAKGIMPGIAIWLTTNVITSSSHSNACSWCFDINTIQKLFNDFCDRDMLSIVKDFPDQSSPNVLYRNCKLHFIRAGKNKAWNKFPGLDSLSSMEKSGNVRMHVMPHVGHWLHSEDLNGMLDIIDANSF